MTTQVVFLKRGLRGNDVERFLVSNKTIYHYAKRTSNFQQVKTFCGLVADVSAPHIVEFGARNAGRNSRCCVKCLTFSTRAQRIGL